MSLDSFEINCDDDGSGEIGGGDKQKIFEGENNELGKRSRLYTVTDKSKELFAKPNKQKFTIESFSTMKFDSVFKTEHYKRNVQLKLQLFNSRIIAQIDNRKRNLVAAAIRAIKSV